MNKSSAFVFKGYKADVSSGKAEFNYKVIRGKEALDFTEKVSFPPVQNSDIPQSFLDSLMENLMLILGISYWKLYCPKEIVVENNFLTKEQADFWNTIYTKGMGEFFYKNKIDFRGLVQFPFIENVQNSVSFPRKDRALLGLGGGKDSIVTAELLKAQNKQFDLFIVGTSRVQIDVANAIGKKPIIINRELDSKLFELNKEKGIYNGHIPISVIYAFLGLFASVLYDYRSVVVGNEKSANYGNVEYLGEIINHQWSKSEEFEKLFKEYIKRFITPDVSYSSPLRNMNELEVTKEFVKYPKYFKIFSSCNMNYKILKQVQNDNGGRWCGKCAKCLFVFTLLAAFLPKEKILGIFGQNLFEGKSLLKTFKELLGLENFKPFECVGTPEEMKLALYLARKNREFNNDFLMKIVSKGNENLIPHEFQKI